MEPINPDVPIERDRYIRILAAIEELLSWIDGQDEVEWDDDGPYKRAVPALWVLRERMINNLRKVEAELSE